MAIRNRLPVPSTPAQAVFDLSCCCFIFLGHTWDSVKLIFQGNLLVQCLQGKRFFAAFVLCFLLIPRVVSCSQFSAPHSSSSRIGAAWAGFGRTPQPLAGVPPSTGTWFDGDENPGQGTGKQKESLCLQGRAGKGLDLLPLQRSQSPARAFHLRMISSTQIFLRLGISLNKLQFKTG